MGNGIQIRVGGILDGSFKGALSKSESEAQASVERITGAQEKAYTAFWNRQAGSTARQRALAKAQSEVETASKRMFAAMGQGWDGSRSSIGNERASLAQAIRAQRALRDIPGGRGGSGEPGGGFGNRSGLLEMGHVLRATADSIASGQHLSTIAAQQMPRILESFVMIGRDGFAQIKDSLSSGLSSLVSKFGGGAGAGVAGAGVAIAGFTIAEFVDMWKAVNEETDKNNASIETLRGHMDAVAKKAKELADAGKLSHERYLNIAAILGLAGGSPESMRGALKEAIGQMPHTDQSDPKGLEKANDFYRRMAIDAETDPEKKKQKRAALNRDEALRQVPELSRESGIPKEEFEAIILKRYQTELIEKEKTPKSEKPRMGHAPAESPLARAGIFANSGALIASQDLMKQHLKVLHVIAKNTSHPPGKGKSGGTRF